MKELCALIPVSPLNTVKSRLKDFLTSEERINLLKNMLLDVYTGIAPFCSNIYIISRDIEILNLFGEYDKINIIKEPEHIKGLNNALNYAFKFIKEENVIITPADIPLIRNENINNIIKEYNNYKAIICPSRGGGTNLMIINRNSINTQFEGFSYLKHINQFKEKNIPYRVYPSFYLSIDVNTVEDLGEILIHGKNTNTYNYLKKLNIEAKPKHSSAGRFKITRNNI